MIPALPVARETTSDYQAFLIRLPETGFTGDVETIFASRLVAATDNSIYQILPAGVLFPKDEADVVRILRLAGEACFQKIRFSARGAGTGTNGQSLTSGLIIDCARHMNRILEINLQEEWVRVQPGVVRDQLNAALKKDGYFFAPTLSPTNRATLGGMINTDACGKGSRVYGRTSNHVLDLNFVLSDGTAIQSGGLSADMLAHRKLLPGREGKIHRVVDEIVSGKAEQIASSFPKMLRFLTGYNLAHVYDDSGHFHVEQLICGSEGSLAVVTEARLNLTKLPPYSLLVAVKYTGFNDALTDAMALLKSEPSAIETVDEKILELARQDAIYYEIKDMIADEGDQQVRTVNLVEYSGFDMSQLESKVSQLKRTIEAGESRAFGYYATSDAKESAALWDLRKKGVGLLGNMAGDRKAIAFVEDTAVPPEHLAEYIAEFRALLEGHGLEFAMYGHVDVGCLHVRPALDPRQETDVRLIRLLSDEVVALVRKYGGIMWAEHGKGFRSEYSPLFFGEELYNDLRRIKEVFDPHNQMNPGKVVTPFSSDEVVVSIEAPLKGQFDRQVNVQDQRGFDPMFACNGNGVCFNQDADHIMCPSSKITRNRIHSPKGRAALLREWLRRLSIEDPASYHHDRNCQPQDSTVATYLEQPAGLLARLFRRKRSGDDFSHQVYDAMAGCLSCKACASQCPIHVDIPEYKATFLELYHSRYARPFRDYLVANLEQGLPLQARLPRLVNALVGFLPDAVMGRITGLINAPKLAVERSSQIMRRRGLRHPWPRELDMLVGEDRARCVLLLPDAFTFFYDTTSFWACYDLLVKLGWQPRILPYRPNGKPLHIKGFLKEFKVQAAANEAFYLSYAATGLPVVCIEPSIALTWRDEYVHALGQPATLKVQLLQEWLVEQTPTLRAAAQDPFYLLGHCMERTAQLASGDQWQSLFAGLGLDLVQVRVGCCGMAGTYGHELEHQTESRGIFEMSWAAQLQNLPQDRVLVTGYSCRTQVARLAHFRPQHPLQALLKALENRP